MGPKLDVFLCAVLTYFIITLIPKSNKTLTTTDTLITLTNLTILIDQKIYQLKNCRICIDYFDFLVFLQWSHLQRIASQRYVLVHLTVVA